MDGTACVACMACIQRCIGYMAATACVACMSCVAIITKCIGYLVATACVLCTVYDKLGKYGLYSLCGKYGYHNEISVKACQTWRCHRHRPS